MKKEIHPAYFPKAVVICSCGAKHVIGSTREKMTVEICSKCHPFYTGKEKLVDTAGRVEKFRTRREKAEITKTTKPKKVIAKTKKAVSKKKATTSKTTTKKKSPAKASTTKTPAKKK